MRRSASVIAISPMVIGKIKISKFRTFMYSNNNFQKRIKTKIILNYKDQNMKMNFNMIKSSMIFGQFAEGTTLDMLTLDIICHMRQDNYHHLDTILSLGEISDRLYFVTQGKVAIFVESSEKFCSSVMKKKGKGEEKEENNKSMLLGYLNVGSNFNHLSAILSQQSIMAFKAVGSNT